MTFNTTSGTDGNVTYEFILGGSTATTTGGSIDMSATTVIRMERPATIEDLERAGFKAHEASVGEMVGAGFVPLDELPEELRAAVEAHFASA